MGMRDFDEFTPVVLSQSGSPAGPAGARRNSLGQSRPADPFARKQSKRRTLQHAEDAKNYAAIRLMQEAEVDDFAAQREIAATEQKRRLNESFNSANALVSRSSTPWPRGREKLKDFLPSGSWLPKNWKHCPTARYWTTKYDVSQRKSDKTKSYGVDLSMTVSLWRPLQEIVDAMPARSRPTQGSLQGISYEENQHLAFARLLSGTMHSRALCEPPSWFEKKSALALPGLGGTAAAPLVTAIDLASACALHHDACRVLQLGAAEPGCGKLVSVFSKVKHLNVNWLPETLPEGLETLNVVLPHATKIDFRTLRKRPTALQEISIHGLSTAKGLGRFLESSDSLSWADLALWENHPPGEELQPAAASIIRNGGLFAWPNSFIFEDAQGAAGVGLVEQKSILMAATHAATRKLQEVVWDAEIALVNSRKKLKDATTETGAPLGNPNQRRSSMAVAPSRVAGDHTWRFEFKEHAAHIEQAAFYVSSPKRQKAGAAVSQLGEHIKALAEMIRYAKEFRVNYEHTERAQGLLLRMQLERIQLEDPKGGPNTKKMSVAMVKTINVPVRGAISHIDAIQALVNLGFPRTQAADLFDYIDCEQKGYLNAGDWRSAVRAGPPAGIAELHSLHDFMMKQFRTLEAAYKNFDEDGTGELDTAEFQAGLERLGWNDAGESVPDSATQGSGYEHRRAPAQELFALLDGSRRSRLIGMDEFSLLACFANVHAMACTEGIAHFMQEVYGTLEAAYRHLDRDKSGGVTQDEFEVFLRENNCPGHECVKDAFNFIDRDCQGYLTRKEIMALQGFSTRAFLKDIRLLRDQMIASYGSLEAAFNVIDSGDEKDKEVSLHEFLEAWLHMDVGHFVKLDVRLLYHFLDTSHDGSVSLREWLRLRCFNADAAQASVRLGWEDLLEKLGRDPDKILNKLHELAAMPSI